MPDLVMVVPSRGRPEAVAELAEAFADTCTAGTRLVLVLDEDEPDRAAYHDALAARPGRPGHTTYVECAQNAAGTMVGALNEAAVFAANVGDWFAIGFMGDDHRPRTVGWDTAYLDALHEMGTGLVFGDDLIQHEHLPTQVAMTADIIRALGYMAPPELTHLYVDNFWLRLGNGLGCLRYLPDVVVEHCHPVAGTGVWDEGHVRVNSTAMYEKDAAAFDGYLHTRFDEDFAKVRAVMAR